MKIGVGMAHGINLQQGERMPLAGFIDEQKPGGRLIRPCGLFVDAANGQFDEIARLPQKNVPQMQMAMPELRIGGMSAVQAPMAVRRVNAGPMRATGFAPAAAGGRLILMARWLLETARNFQFENQLKSVGKVE